MIRNRLISLFGILLLSICSVSAQIRIISREKLDSVSSPALASNAEALAFEMLHIEAEPMSEDDAPESFRYRFTNVSDSPLRIDRVVSTCSCAQARCSKTVVYPGEDAEVIVTYNPKGHPGRFERRFFLYTGDNDSPSAILRLKVDVTAGVSVSSIFPVAMGRIRLRSSEVKVNPFNRSVERLRFVNVSDAPIRLECDRMILPDCLSFRTEPETVQSGEEGDIVIVFDQEKYSSGPERQVMMVIVNGLGLPPGQSSITVKVDK